MSLEGVSGTLSSVFDFAVQHGALVALSAVAVVTMGVDPLSILHEGAVDIASDLFGMSPAV